MSHLRQISLYVNDKLYLLIQWGVHICFPLNVRANVEWFVFIKTPQIKICCVLWLSRAPWQFFLVNDILWLKTALYWCFTLLTRHRTMSQSFTCFSRQLFQLWTPFLQICKHVLHRVFSSLNNFPVSVPLILVQFPFYFRDVDRLKLFL